MRLLFPTAPWWSLSCELPLALLAMALLGVLITIIVNETFRIEPQVPRAHSLPFVPTQQPILGVATLRPEPRRQSPTQSPPPPRDLPNSFVKRAEQT